MTNVTSLKTRKAKAKCENEAPILKRMQDGEISMKDAASLLTKECGYSIEQAWQVAKAT